MALLQEVDCLVERIRMSPAGEFMACVACLTGDAAMSDEVIQVCPPAAASRWLSREDGWCGCVGESGAVVLGLTVQHTTPVA